MKMPKLKYTLVKTNNMRVVNYEIPKQTILISWNLQLNIGNLVVSAMGWKSSANAECVLNHTLVCGVVTLRLLHTQTMNEK